MNFSVTQSGLELQLLALVVRKERRDLAEARGLFLRALVRELTLTQARDELIRAGDEHKAQVCCCAR